MYRKPRFLEELHAIREEMSRECDYDIDLFAQMVRSGQHPRSSGPLNATGPAAASSGAASGDRERRSIVRHNND